MAAYAYVPVVSALSGLNIDFFWEKSCFCAALFVPEGVVCSGVTTCVVVIVGYAPVRAGLGDGEASVACGFA